MEIILKSLEFKNFKGIKERVINFTGETNIYGENATGKTTIQDAFNWLLFGKDSKDRKDFEIKTIDENGEVLHGLEHKVVGVLEIDGQLITLERLYKEKWVKERGAADKELKGHTTEYLINEVPQSQKEYQGKINAIFEESKFKLVTSPLFFTNQKWQDQRKILLEVVGDICESDIFAHNKELKKLENKVTDGIENFNAMNKNKIKKVKEKIKTLPARIDELNIGIINFDYPALEVKVKEIKEDIKDIEDQLENKGKANTGKLKLEEDLYKIEHEYQEKVQAAERDKNKPYYEIQQLLRENKDAITLNERKLRNSKLIKSENEQTIDDLILSNKWAEEENKTLREKFTKVKADILKLDKDCLSCPTCKRSFDDSEQDRIINEMETNFNNEKTRQIDKINLRGKANITRIKTNKTEIENIENANIKVIEQIQDLTMIQAALNTEIEMLQVEEKNIIKINSLGKVEFEGQKELLDQIKTLETSLKAYETDDNSELRSIKSKLIKQLEQANKELNYRESNQVIKNRIAELEEEEKTLSQQIVELEGLQFLGEEYVRTKVSMLEGKINKTFGVDFKLFKNQINGGLEECCEALIEGVPFGNVNTAGQINGGLKIVNALCKHYKVQAPIFIDNAESVNNIVNTNSQQIKLYVSKDKELVVK